MAVIILNWMIDHTVHSTQSRSQRAPKTVSSLSNLIVKLSRNCYATVSWWRGTVVERRSLAGELSLSCARPAADG